VTEDKCIERQEEMNCGIRLQMSAKADRPIMIWTKAGITRCSLETVEINLQSVRHTDRPQNGGVGCRHIL
jgi:hypothetical protein